MSRVIAHRSTASTSATNTLLVPDYAVVEHGHDEREVPDPLYWQSSGCGYGDRGSRRRGWAGFRAGQSGHGRCSPWVSLREGDP